MIKIRQQQVVGNGNVLVWGRVQGLGLQDV